MAVAARWFDDKDVAPEYLSAMDRFDSLVAALRQEGLTDQILIELLLNVHARILAAGKPTDEQVSKEARILKRATIAIRDGDPKAFQREDD